MLVAQLWLTLCDPMDCSPPGSSVDGILQARILQWVAIPFSRASSRPRFWTRVSCIGRQILYHWATKYTAKVNLIQGEKPKTMHIEIYDCILLNFFFFNLAVLGLSHNTCDLRSSLWHAGCLVAGCLVAACKPLVATCGNLVSWPGTEPGTPALEAHNLSHWTTREVTVWLYFQRLTQEKKYLVQRKDKQQVWR